MTPIKYSIINNLTNVYECSNCEELQHVMEYRRKDVLGWSDRFSSHGKNILTIYNIAHHKSKNEARKK